MAIASVNQISLSLSRERYVIALATSVSESRLLRDLKTVRDHVDPIFDPAGIPVPLNNKYSPFNVCIAREFANNIENVHRLLDRALVDVVQRWYTDKQADFPSRMPLEQHEDDLLQWISSQEQSTASKAAGFCERSGLWRTDFLIEGQAGHEIAKICEINARIPFNGLYIAGLHQEATKPLGEPTLGFDLPSDFQDTKEKILGCFDTSKPIYHVHKKWPGVDSRLFASTYKETTGLDMATIEPSQLSVEQDDSSPTGWALYANVKSSGVEGKFKVEQCAVELFQEEIGDIDPLVLRQLATRSVNDFRTILLLHDKRILGIIQQEIPHLVARNVLSAAEGTVLHNGIADTVISGSDEVRRLLEDARQDSLVKNRYIIKPVRDASCNGIRFGEQLEQADWLSLLEHMASRALHPVSDDGDSGGACVVQRLVDHARHDIVCNDVNDVSAKAEQFHLIGSCHMINSQSFIWGPWRIGDKVHVGLGPDARGIVMSAVLQPADLEQLDGKKEE